MPSIFIGIPAGFGTGTSWFRSRSQVCNIRRSERLARVEERERFLETVHSEVLQDLFAAELELDRALTRAAPASAARIEAARDALERAMGTLREVVRP